MVDSSYLLAVNSYFDIFLGLQNTYSSSWILWLLVVLPASMASLASLASMASPSSLPQFDGPPVGGGRQEAPRARQRWHKIGRCSFFAQLYSLPCKFPQSSQQMASHWLPLFCMSFSPICQLLILKSGNCQFGRKQESSTDQFVATVNFF